MVHHPTNSIDFQYLTLEGAWDPTDVQSQKVLSKIIDKYLDALRAATLCEIREGFSTHVMWHPYVHKPSPVALRAHYICLYDQALTAPNPDSFQLYLLDWCDYHEMLVVAHPAPHYTSIERIVYNAICRLRPDSRIALSAEPSTIQVSDRCIKHHSAILSAQGVQA